MRKTNKIRGFVIHPNFEAHSLVYNWLYLSQRKVRKSVRLTHVLVLCTITNLIRRNQSHNPRSIAQMKESQSFQRCDSRDA